MLSCKDVTKLVSDDLDRDLSLWKRMGLWVHVTMCKGCSAYRRQVISLNRAVSEHYQNDQASEDCNDLSDDALQKIKKSIRGDRSNLS